MSTSLHIPTNDQFEQIQKEFLYLFKVGFPQVYPLLIQFLSLTKYLQNDVLSCVDAIIIIEYYLNQMRNNIEEYEIEEGHLLIECIEKRLRLYRNVYMYHFGSLFTPDGIVRYRRLMDFDNLEEDHSLYWRIK